MTADKKLLEGIVCWLVINSLEAECKACNFLMQQDLAALYRRHSLRQLLTMVTSADFGSAPAPASSASASASASSKGPLGFGSSAVREHLESFREDVSLDVLDAVKTPKTFAMTLERMRDDPSHARFIGEGGGGARMARIFEKLAKMTSGAEGGLSQEQEQEQEEERETESAAPPDDQPIIFSDIAFARSDEKAPSWRLSALASEEAASRHFYPAAEFGLPSELGVRLPFPPFLRVSDGFFRREWDGPRRIKNAILLLEWLPTQEGFALDAAAGAKLRAKPDAAQLARIHALLADGGGALSAAAVETLLRCAMHVDVSADTLGALLAAQPGPGGAVPSAEALGTLLVSPQLQAFHSGRHFVAVSLKEAETLRAAIHARRKTSLLPADATSDAPRIGLRSLARHGALLDASHQCVAA